MNAAPQKADPASENVELSRAEKLKLQIMRVQIKLTSLRLYEGPINGVLGPATTAALKHFQTLKSLPPSGQMTTDTMNALGIVAVR